MRVEWDAKKDLQNRKRHSIAFADAQAIFVEGADCLDIYDVDHSDVEERFISIGPIRRGIVVIVWIETFEDTIRIISARFATKRERALYAAYMEGSR